MSHVRNFNHFHTFPLPFPDMSLTFLDLSGPPIGVEPHRFPLESKAPAPRAAQGRFLSCLGGHPGPTWLPRASRGLPGSHFGPTILAGASASSGGSRGALSNAYSPFPSTSAYTCERLPPGAARSRLMPPGAGGCQMRHAATSRQELHEPRRAARRRKEHPGTPRVWGRRRGDSQRNLMRSGGALNVVSMENQPRQNWSL